MFARDRGGGASASFGSCRSTIVRTDEDHYPMGAWLDLFVGRRRLCCRRARSHDVGGIVVRKGHVPHAVDSACSRRRLVLTPTHHFAERELPHLVGGVSMSRRCYSARRERDYGHHRTRRREYYVGLAKSWLRVAVRCRLKLLALRARRCLLPRSTILFTATATPRTRWSEGHDPAGPGRCLRPQLPTNSGCYVRHADGFAEMVVGQWDMLAHFKRRATDESRTRSPASAPCVVRCEVDDERTLD